MKQALEALESCGEAHITDGGNQWHDAKLVDTAIASLRQAIKELESQEPVAWRAPNWSNLHGEYGYRDFDDPVIDISNGKPSPNNEPLYIHPPQRTWVGLTDEEIADEFYKFESASAWYQFAHAIEAKLRDKNK